MNNMNYDTFCDLFNISKVRYSQSGVKNPTKTTIQFSYNSHRRREQQRQGGQSKWGRITRND